jgi:hypothetical protein
MSTMAVEIASDYWKLTIQEQITWRELEDTLSRAMREVLRDADGLHPSGMIENVDRQDGETVVLLSGNRSAAEIFLQAFRGALPRASIGLSQIL